MPSFSERSRRKLMDCDTRLQALFENVVLTFDCTIITGHRTKEEQNAQYAAGRSKVRWPDSKHNSLPSTAVDAGPYLPGRKIPWPVTPTDWGNSLQRNNYIKDLAQFYSFANFVMGMAEALDLPVRWGGDWDMDHDLRDNKFDDLVHFELIGGF